MMKKKYLSVGLSLLALTGIIIGTALWGQAFYASIQNYRSPLHEVSLPPQPPVALQNSHKLVVVLIGGLGYDASQALDLPVFNQLRGAGADLAVQSTPPTYSQTAWATLITGAPPETNDAPPVDLAPEDLHSLEVDTLFARAHGARLQTALLGLSDWRRLVPRNQLDYTFFADQAGAEADAAIIEAALPVIAREDVAFTLLHFSQVDIAGQISGADSEAYRQAARQVDAYLGQISQTLDLSRAVLVVLGDHGHIPDGGHGGNEVEVIWQPLVIVGKDIVPGSYSDIYQTDIAPTLATLLGLAAPTASQGRIMFELLRFSEQDRAIAQLALAQQRLALAETYLTQLNSVPTSLPETIPADMTRAQTAFAAHNISGAFQLALLTQQEVDRYMHATKNSQVQAAQWLRLPVAVFIVLLWLTLMWRRRGAHAGSIVLAVIFTLALYHVLYQLQGHTYSVSGLRSFSGWPIDIARRTAVSLLAGGGLLLVFLMMVREENWLTLLGTGYGFGLLVTFIFALPLLWAFWQNGLLVGKFLPAIIPAFWQITGLLEVMIAAILGLLLPWPIMTLNLFVNWVRRRLDENRARAKSDVLPGLHL